VTITITNLPPGSYDLYIYSSDGSFQVSSGVINYGTTSAYDSTFSFPTLWTIGIQYVLYSGVAVTNPGQSVIITASARAGGTAPHISGIQIIQRRDLPIPTGPGC
jgi:hypothetical protein